MLVRALYTFGNKSEDNRLELEEALAGSVMQMISGKGNQVVNASANGLSVSIGQGMDLPTWVASLTAALEHIENGTKPGGQKWRNISVG